MSKDERYDVSQHEGHTSGPWWLCCEDGTLYARWIQADEKSICSDLNEATEVDAQLLTRAPEILDALKNAYEEIDSLRYTIGCFAYDDMQFSNGVLCDKHGSTVEDYSDYITDEHRNETASE